MVTVPIHRADTRTFKFIYQNSQIIDLRPVNLFREFALKITGSIPAHCSFVSSTLNLLQNQDKLSILF